MASDTKEDTNFKFYVIGAGLPRTGTLSMKAALEKILPGKCMHFKSVVEEGNLKEVLHDVFEETSTEESFRNYFQKYNIVAGVDIPFLFHYKRAMGIFPEAKVLLTVREPSTWVTSMEKTIYSAWKNIKSNAFPLSFLMYFFPAMKRLSKYVDNHEMYNKAVRSIDNGKGMEYFDDWVEDVKKTVPPDRLLVFSVKEGWKPLCEFLDLPIPDEPFPHVNDTEEFQQGIKFFKLIGWVVFIAATTLPIVFGYSIFRYFY